MRSRLIQLASLAVLGIAVWGAWSFFQTPSSLPVQRVDTKQVPAAVSLPLHPAVAAIIGQGEAAPYLKVHYLIQEIPTNLAGHDIDALLGYITATKPDLYSDSEWGSLTNDIQEALSVQTIPSRKVADTLIATYRDEGRTQLMRDYALQHIGGFAIYLIHTAHSREGKLPEFFPRLTGELLTATQDSSKPWCGTALNLLDGVLRAAEYCSMVIPEVSAESLAALAVPVMESTTAPLNARLPALQLASRRSSPEALPFARRVLADAASPLMLIQCAAAVLATHGTEDDLALLKSLRSQDNPHTILALSEAIRRISER